MATKTKKETPVSEPQKQAPKTAPSIKSCKPEHIIGITVGKVASALAEALPELNEKDSQLLLRMVFASTAVELQISLGKNLSFD